MRPVEKLFVRFGTGELERHFHLTDVPRVKGMLDSDHPRVLALAPKIAFFLRRRGYLPAGHHEIQLSPFATIRPEFYVAVVSSELKTPEGQALTSVDMRIRINNEGLRIYHP